MLKAFDFARMGYEVTANEFSFFMLHAANWVLNQCEKKNSVEFHPFLHQITNVIDSNDRFKAVSIV